MVSNVKSMMFYTDDEINYLKDVCLKSVNYNQAALKASKNLERSFRGIVQKLRCSKYPLMRQKQEYNLTRPQQNNKKTFVITITIEEK